MSRIYSLERKGVRLGFDFSDPVAASEFAIGILPSASPDDDPIRIVDDHGDTYAVVTRLRRPVKTVGLGPNPTWAELVAFVEEQGRRRREEERAAILADLERRRRP